MGTMEIIYHTYIEVSTIAKNGSEKFGATAKCKMWYKGSSFKMDVSQHGATKKEGNKNCVKYGKEIVIKSRTTRLHQNRIVRTWSIEGM